MSVRTKKTNTEFNLDIVNEYKDSGQPWPATGRQIAAWAVRTGKWKSERKTQEQQCARELADAMRLEMEKDPQGRTVRAKYCATVQQADEDGNLVQRTLWFDRSAKPDLMRLSLQQRRKVFGGGLKQLKTDQDSYNENNQYGAVVQLSFDFTQDLAELEQDTEYRPKPIQLDDDHDED